ncbi:hypothetical protein A3L09_05830 [Thermococcus profundus]|uniref:Uncharacterized protein n=1 Tax=Thermococcus profundus TaxID=49899 RepID=A0A2Z2M925_THEPR|nr:sodium-dependent transporter [Thermococcus profundus]ASJ02807.1 hypothetical protein A3L09_05830 [Thermococcus profundus]
MRKISILMALLITGYVLGIWNFLLMPKYYITFGLKGFAISLIVLAIGLLLIFSELEATRRTRYLIHEFFVKVARFPAVTLTLLMFLMIMGGLTLYFSSRALGEIFELNSRALASVIIGVILVIWVFLVLLKGRSVEFIGAMAVLFIIFAIAATLVMRQEVHSFVRTENALQQLNAYRDAIFSFNHPLTVRGLVLMFITVLLSLGLGAGVYYVLGSFAPAELDLKKLLGAVIILQIILSFAAALTTAYAIGAAYQSYDDAYTTYMTEYRNYQSAKIQYSKIHEELARIFSNPESDPNKAIEILKKQQQLKETLKKMNQTLARMNQTLTVANKKLQTARKAQIYANSSTQPPMRAIENFYFLSKVIRESKLPEASNIIFLLMSSLFLAGFTTLIVLVEIGAQISAEVFQLRRVGSVTFLSAGTAVLGLISIVVGIREMLLTVPFAVGAIIMAIEAVPLIKGASPFDRGTVTAAILGTLLVGLAGVYYMLKTGGTYVTLGVLLSLMLFLPLLFNGYLLAQSRGGR